MPIGAVMNAGMAGPKRLGRKRIGIAIPEKRALLWMTWLAAALEQEHEVTFVSVPCASSGAIPSSVFLVLQLERIIYGSAKDCAIGDADLAGLRFEVLGFPGRTFDVVIDCCGGDTAMPPAGRVLRLTYGGVPGEAGALSALFDGVAAELAVVDGKSGLIINSAIPAVSDRRLIGRSVDEIYSMAVELIVATLKGALRPNQQTAEHSASKSAAQNARQSLLFAASGLARNASKWLTIQLSSHERWFVGWRYARTETLLDSGSARFACLLDDGKRFYADPFPIRWKGDTYVFVEEFPFATQRGRIAVVKLGEYGQVSSPRPVLEEPYHLSYPQVFSFGGEIWMVPEGGANSSVHLYRAVDFPHRWRREAVLIENVGAYDATLHFDSGTWWMLVSICRNRGTGWDTLSIFRADRLDGPWQAVESASVLNARCARSAGAIIAIGATRLRPAQDCTQFYGGGVSMNRIDRLDRNGFQQTPVGRIQSNEFGLHTYNCAGGVEVIDIFGRLGGRTLAEANYVPLPVAAEQAAAAKPASSALEPHGAVAH